VIENIEFVRFHPTALFVACSEILVVGSAGDGGILRNVHVWRLCGDITRCGSAPRIGVAVDSAEMKRTDSPNVWLICRAGSITCGGGFREFMKRAWRMGRCNEVGAGASRGALCEAGEDGSGRRTSVEGLYAAGSACTGRAWGEPAASNSCWRVVFGRRARW